LHARLTADPANARVLAALESISKHIGQHLRVVNIFVEDTHEQMVSDDGYTTWLGDRALVELMERGASKDFFRRNGPARTNKLYGGWERTQMRETEFLMTHMR
jgi:hypothetical protein